MTTPMERTTVLFRRTAVSLAQIMGMHAEICLVYYEGGKWECTQAAPEVWFGLPFLEILSSSPLDGTPWSRVGDCIKLTVTNGSWVWRLTGETAPGENIDGLLELHRAVWPD